MFELLYLLIVTHLTIVSVTLYLHRCQAHKAIDFHPVASHAMRFWLWLTTGMVTKQWVAIHRKHHRYCDTVKDPHSPHTHGLFSVLFGGAFLYAKAAKDNDMVNTYGAGTPADWVEHNIYTRFNLLGIISLLVLNCTLFSWWGLLIWGIQMVWIPFWAAGVVNGVGHYWGYRNGETKDRSRNIIPWGIIIGGEELHNNHHLDPANAKLSRRRFEFDLGWIWLKLFVFLKLAKIKRAT